MELAPNPGKNLIINVDGKKYARYPIKTHILTPKDDISEVAERYAKKYLKPGDIVFIGERCVAVTQGRTYSKERVKPCRLSRFLVRFVTKSPYGIGLGSPETMQLAIEEVGVLRILLAAFFTALTKPFGIKGVFYLIAGPQAKAVDGAADYVIPPYNTHVTKAPLKPNKVAQAISEKIDVPVAIVDACDVGVWIVGASKGVVKEDKSSSSPTEALAEVKKRTKFSSPFAVARVNKKLIIKALKDNPLGQSREQTPIGILREVSR